MGKQLFAFRVTRAAPAQLRQSLSEGLVVSGGREPKQVGENTSFLKLIGEAETLQGNKSSQLPCPPSQRLTSKGASSIWVQSMQRLLLGLRGSLGDTITEGT